VRAGALSATARPIPVFIGYDPHERAAVNVLTDSLVQHSSQPLAITPIVARQLEDPPSGPPPEPEHRVLLVELWQQRDDRYAVMGIKHHQRPRETSKFLGAVQSRYERKNWSSLMLYNCARCTALTPAYVNSTSGLALHRFEWLALIDVQPPAPAPVE